MALGAEVAQSCVPEPFMRVGNSELHGALGPWPLSTPSFPLVEAVVGRPDWEAASLAQLSFDVASPDEAPQDLSKNVLVCLTSSTL